MRRTRSSSSRRPIRLSPRKPADPVTATTLDWPLLVIPREPRRSSGREGGAGAPFRPLGADNETEAGVPTDDETEAGAGAPTGRARLERRFSFKAGPRTYPKERKHKNDKMANLSPSREVTGRR